MHYSYGVAESMGSLYGLREGNSQRRLSDTGETRQPNGHTAAALAAPYSISPTGSFDAPDADDTAAPLQSTPDRRASRATLTDRLLFSSDGGASAPGKNIVSPTGRTAGHSPNCGVLSWHFDMLGSAPPSAASTVPSSAKAMTYISTSTGSSLHGGDSAGYERRRQAQARGRPRSSTPCAVSTLSLHANPSPLPPARQIFCPASVAFTNTTNSAALTESSDAMGKTGETLSTGGASDLNSRNDIGDPSARSTSAPNHSGAQFFDISSMVDSIEGVAVKPTRYGTGSGSSDATTRQPPAPPSIPQAPSRCETMRSASQSWDNRSRSQTLFPNARTTESRRLDTTRVLSVVIIADAGPDQAAAAELPPPLEPLAEFEHTPKLQPLKDDSKEASNGTSSTIPAGESFVADEVVKVSYCSGVIASGTVSLQVMREHFLSGHNVMIFVGNTPRTTCLAEDMLSTIISEVYTTSESMGPSIINEIAISAYGVIAEDGLVANLLPTTLAETTWENMKLSANPIAGVVISNYQPTYVWAKEQARYLSRGLVHNARVMEADPHSNAQSLIWVTLLLKQTRLSSADPPEQGTPLSETAASGEVGADPGSVYVSSLHLVFSGYGMPLVDEIIQHESLQVWPLFRHAFGGQCRTAVVAMIDGKDSRSRTQPLLAVATSRGQSENQPPHSGSVLQFLSVVTASVAQSGESHDSSSFAMMRDGATALLEDPCADIPFYDSDSQPDTRPFRRAHQVVMLEAPSPPPKPAPTPTPVSAPLSPLPPAPPPPPPPPRHPATPSPPSAPTKKEHSNLSVVAESASEEPTSSSTSTIRVAMPSTVRAREATARMLDRMRHTRDAAAAERWPSLRLNEGGTSGTGGARRAGNRTESVLLLDVPVNTPTPDAPRKTESGRSDGDEPVVQLLDDTHVALLAPHALAKANADLFDGPSLDSTQTLGGGTHAVVRCRFRADAVRAVRPVTRRAPLSSLNAQEAAAHRDAQLTALLSVPQMGDAAAAFVREERNVAVLATSCVGIVRPFAQQPVWGAVRLLLNEVIRAHQQRHDAGTPTTLTLFGSLLAGRRILRDIADPDSPAHADEYPEADVGMSPLFGPLLYRTRSVDLRHENDVGEVLTAMLARADETAGTHTVPFVVVTCAQKTTRALAPEELSLSDRNNDYRYDATFSSFTVVSTRNSTQLFRSCVVRDPAEYPISILTDAIHGATKTVALLHLDAAQADPTVSLEALLTHNRMMNVRKLAPRSGRVRAYIAECVTGMRRVEQKAQRRPSLTEAEAAKLRERFDAFDAMAHEHEVFLADCEQEGYVLYPGHGNRPSVADPNTTRDTNSLDDSVTLPEDGARQPEADRSSSGSRTAETALTADPPPLVSETQRRQRADTPPPKRADDPFPIAPPRPASSPSDVAVAPRAARPPEEAATPVTPGGPIANATTAAAGAQRRTTVSAKPVNAAAGIVVHAMVLFAHVASGSATEADAEAKGHMLLSSGRRGDLHLISFARDTEQEFQLDEVVELGGCGDQATDHARNATSFAKSELLTSAISSFLSGSNAALVLQETQAAEEALVVDSLLAEVVAACLHPRPAEVEFFFSAALIPASAGAMVDLLHVDASGAGEQRVEEAALQLGFSALTGPVVLSARLEPLATAEDAARQLTAALRADRRRGARTGGRLLVLNLLQKTVVEVEQDVSVSSMLIVLARGSPGALQEVGGHKAVEPLMRYALAGQCLSVCATAVTDAEPEAGGADRALMHQQNTLCGFSGKPIGYNSYRDLLIHHRDRFASFKAQYKAIAAELASGRAIPDDKRAALEQKRGALKLSMARVAAMMEDEQRVLDGGGLPGLPPPFYPLQGKR